MAEPANHTALGKHNMKVTGRIKANTSSSETRAKGPPLVVHLILLASLIPFGVFSMHILMHRNGYYAAMVHLRDVGPHLLPGTQDPLVRKYTGSGFLDYWLTVLVCFFANAVDGSKPELSVFCVLFAANMGPCLVLVYVESLREGREWSVLWFACLWCLSMQTLSFGLTMPLYCIISLLTGPKLLVSPSPRLQIDVNRIRALRVIPWSMTLGYIIPTILMCMGNLSSTVHQYLLAFWQPFPLWVALFQVIFNLGTFTFSLSRHQTEEVIPSSSHTSMHRPMIWLGLKSSFLQYQISRKADTTRFETLRALAYATKFASYFAISIHWITIFVLFISKLAPRVSAYLGVPQLNIIKIFAPANPFSPVPITAMPQGVLAFLQYDFYNGILAALIWTSFQNYELEVLKGIGFSRWLNIWTIFANVLLFGPGATVIGYAYLREAKLQLTVVQRLQSIYKAE